MRREQPRILAVASGGGHWVELLRLRPAFEGAEVVYITVRRDYAGDVDGHEFYVVNDATRWNRLALILVGTRLLVLLLRLRPDVVVTTGAAPGYIALRLARLLGMKTVWLDSVANAEELSMSGRMAGGCADLWLTQWAHLSQESGPEFAGSVL